MGMTLFACHRQITGELRDVNEFYEIEQKELGHGAFASIVLTLTGAQERRVVLS